VTVAMQNENFGHNEKLGVKKSFREES